MRIPLQLLTLCVVVFGANLPPSIAFKIVEPAANSPLWVADSVEDQQQPVFHSGAQAVEVDVRVFSGSGEFVSSLQASDFLLKEDGISQTILSVSLVGAPPSALKTGAPAASISRTGSPATVSTPTPSTWIFLFDTIHLSPGSLKNTRAAVKAFIAKMGRDDLVGVVADGQLLDNHLTTDHKEMASAVDSIKFQGEEGSLMAEMKFDWPRLQDEYEAWRIAEQDDPQAIDQAVRRACQDDVLRCGQSEAMVRAKAHGIDQQLQQRSQQTLAIVHSLAGGLARLPGPKTIVFLSDGFSLWGVGSELRDATGDANRAGAHYYAIDVRGLNKGHNADMLQETLLEDLSSGPTFDEHVDAPTALAVDTGGMFIHNQNDIGRVLDEIQKDAGTYYVLSYSPTNDKFDGKYRSISVTVRRDGMKVRARRGYLAVDPAKLLRASK